MIEGVSLVDVLAVGTIMFFIGTYGFLTRKNMISMLISVEIMLNAVNLNFIAINKYLHPQALEGHFFILFIIAIAAAEAAVAIAIFINIYRSIHSIDVDDVTEMRY